MSRRRIIAASALAATVIVVACTGCGTDQAESRQSGEPTVAPELPQTHPDEMSVLSPTTPQVASLPQAPKIVWSTEARVLAADDDAVITSDGVVLDAIQGAERFRLGLRPEETVADCALAASHVRCLLTVPAYGGPRRLVMMNTRTGATSQARDFLDRRIAVGELFLTWSGVEPGTSDQQSTTRVAVLRPDGTRVWQATRPGALTAYPDAGLFSLQGPDGVRIFAVDDGHLIATAPRAQDRPTWTPYDGGVAVMTADGSATDLHALDGSDVVRVDGWTPAVLPRVEGPPDPLPILRRQSNEVFGAVNPATGHVIEYWNQPAVGAQALRTLPIGDDLLLSPILPAAPTPAWVGIRTASGYTAHRVDAGAPTGADDGIWFDGERVIAARDGHLTAYRLDQQHDAVLWSAAPSPTPPAAFAGAKPVYHRYGSALYAERGPMLARLG